jgi:hypothetical protein
MVALAWILLAVASTNVELVDEVYRIPAAEWKYVEINLRQQPALVSAAFDVPGGAGQVRLALMTRADLEHFRNSLAHGILAITPIGSSGTLNFQVREPSDYVLVVDNRAGTARPAAVHLRVALDFGQPIPAIVTTISPRRQLAVIALSFLFFFTIVTYSAKKLLKLSRR